LFKPIFQSGLAKALELLIIVPLAKANGNEGHQFIAVPFMGRVK
jgi:hypothetical protein